MNSEELKVKVVEAFEALGYVKDKNGQFSDEIYTDYRDELGNDQIREILSAKEPKTLFYEKLDGWYTDARIELENDTQERISAYLNDIGLEKVLEENEQLFLDTFYDLYYVKNPDDHFLDQDIDINIVLDTGDANYDFACNTFANSYYCDPEDEIDEHSSLLWLCEQQGVSKEELEHALKTGEYYPEEMQKTFNRVSEINKELKELGYISERPNISLCHTGAYKTFYELKEKIGSAEKKLRKAQERLDECKMSYEDFCAKYTTKISTPPSEERWKEIVNENLPKVNEHLESAKKKLQEANEALQAEFKNNPDVYKVSCLRDELSSLAEPMYILKNSEEYKKGLLMETVIAESRNTSSGLNALAALVKMPLGRAIDLAEVIRHDEIFNKHSEPEDRLGQSNIVLGEDTVIGLYDSWNGAGSLFEITLIKPIELPVKFIHDANVDGTLGYGIGEIYGGMDYKETLQEINEIPTIEQRKELNELISAALDTAHRQASEKGNEPSVNQSFEH